MLTPCGRLGWEKAKDSSRMLHSGRLYGGKRLEQIVATHDPWV